MTNIERLDLGKLDAQGRQSFYGLTEPKFYPCLKGENPDGIPNTITLAIAAFIEGKPIGLLLATFFSAMRMAEIHSLYVTDESEDREISGQLIQCLEEELQKNNCVVISYVYSSSDPETPNLEKLLNKLGWPAPRLFGIQCRFDGRTFNPPWMQAKYTFPSGFTLFPWSELTFEERKVLMRQLEHGEIHPSVSPFQEEDLIEPINSLGLRYKGSVVGWMVTHRITPNTIRYTALYIERSHQLQGPAIFLLKEAIERQIRSPIPWGVLEMNVRQTELSWLNFVKRRLRPYATEVTYTKQAWKGS